MGVFLLTFCLVNCAPPSHTNFTNIDPAFQPYVQLFEYEANQHGRQLQITSLIVKFDNLLWYGPNTIGLCYEGITSPPRILIDKEFWDSATDASREILMFHELGHCILNREHNDSNIMLNGVVYGPASVMNSYIIDDFFYVPFRDYYLQELFF